MLKDVEIDEMIMQVRLILLYFMSLTSKQSQ